MVLCKVINAKDRTSPSSRVPHTHFWFSCLGLIGQGSIFNNCSSGNAMRHDWNVFWLLGRQEKWHPDLCAGTVTEQYLCIQHHEQNWPEGNRPLALRGRTSHMAPNSILNWCWRGVGSRGLCEQLSRLSVDSERFLPWPGSKWTPHHNRWISGEFAEAKARGW